MSLIKIRYIVFVIEHKVWLVFLKCTVQSFLEDRISTVEEQYEQNPTLIRFAKSCPATQYVDMKANMETVSFAKIIENVRRAPALRTVLQVRRLLATYSIILWVLYLL